MKKSKLYLSNIEKEHPDLSYEELYDYIFELISDGKLAPVKSALTNGRKPALPVMFWMEAYEEYMTSQLSMCYCLTGDGDYIAQKALKFERLLSPLETASDKYEKVQVEVMNIGEQGRYRQGC